MGVSDLNCHMQIDIECMDELPCFYCESMLSEGWAGWVSCLHCETWHWPVFLGSDGLNERERELDSPSLESLRFPCWRGFWRRRGRTVHAPLCCRAIKPIMPLFRYFLRETHVAHKVWQIGNECIYYLNTIEIEGRWSRKGLGRVPRKYLVTLPLWLHQNVSQRSPNILLC